MSIKVGTTSVQNTDLFHIHDKDRLYHGANQEWYGTEWQRRAGCGPTVCSHVMWYLSQTREGLGALCPHDGGSKQGFISLMEDVWHYVTPGMRGVNKTSIFYQGALRYGFDRGIELGADWLDISPMACKRPPLPVVLDFIGTALESDLPVAFLNLSNGKLSNLDNWHWVTLLGLEQETGLALMFDQGRQSMIDLALWLSTTSLGGGFVVTGAEGEMARRKKGRSF